MSIHVSKDCDLEFLPDVERSAAKKFISYRTSESQNSGRVLAHDIILKAHKNKTLWIAFKNNDPIGFLAATPVDKGLHIEELSVMFDHQGQGIGKQLIQAIITEARIREHSLISLTTDALIPWNKPFYERLGFQEIALNNCKADLSKVLIKDKGHSDIPENRIAMILKF